MSLGLLGNDFSRVTTFPTTDSINLDSSEILATAKSVKTLNDATVKYSERSDSISSSSSDTVATSKAVNDLSDSCDTLYMKYSGGNFTGEVTCKNEEIIHIPNSAAAHNGVFRGKDLTNVYTLDQLSAKLANNDFSDLFIGDYITKTFTNLSNTSVTADFLFAGFDYWLRKGGGDTYTRKQGYTISNYECTFHHILMIPRDPLGYAVMNSTNTTTGCYIGSAMNTTCISYATKLSASNVFGDHIKVFTNWENGNMNANYASAAGAGFTGSTTFYNNSQAGYDWAAHKLRLPTENMVYGNTNFSCSGYEAGCGTSQLPLFALKPETIACGSSRFHWWLSSVASSTFFAVAYYTGAARCGGASNSLGVRPFFLFA